MNKLQDFFRECTISYYNLNFLLCASILRDNKTECLLSDVMYKLNRISKDIFNMILLSGDKIESLRDMVENYDDFILQGNCKFEEVQLQKIFAKIINKIIIGLEETINSGIPEDFKIKLEDGLRALKEARYDINSICIKTHESFISFCDDIMIK